MAIDFHEKNLPDTMPPRLSRQKQLQFAVFIVQLAAEEFPKSDSTQEYTIFSFHTMNWTKIFQQIELLIDFPKWKT